ncbi:MAG: hypothetical protein AAGB04_32685 [Pseudomonadota bacterium]
MSIGIDLPDNLAALHQDVWKRIKSSTFKKTEFAMNVLAYEPPQQEEVDEGANNGVAQPPWNVPQYISEGLVWLDGQLSQNAEEA